MFYTKRQLGSLIEIENENLIRPLSFDLAC